jgi:hypothetical protein
MSDRSSWSNESESSELGVDAMMALVGLFVPAFNLV